MKTLCVIPARLASTRLPRKMLREVQGVPMIKRTVMGAQTCQDLDKIVLTTDSEEIAEVVKDTGVDIIMTPSDLATGSDRVAYVAEQYPDFDVIVNLQGDEPFIKPGMLSDLIKPFSEEGNQPVMATVAFPILEEDEYLNPNFVKVTVDHNNDALLFSRSPIPYNRENIPLSELPVLHHMGLYAYQRDFLLKYTQMPQTPLEKTELLEQLRAMENGYKIRVTKTHERTLEVNTPEELEMAQSYQG